VEEQGTPAARVILSQVPRKSATALFLREKTASSGPLPVMQAASRFLASPVKATLRESPFLLYPAIEA
jgi:hypothetical protein